MVGIDTRALLPANQVLLTLRFYATGSFLRAAGDFLGFPAVYSSSSSPSKSPKSMAILCRTAHATIMATEVAVQSISRWCSLWLYMRSIICFPSGGPRMHYSALFLTPQLKDYHS
ncbi:hypothetical protein NQ317_018414 [Molorchus minor]|uniref:Uncharacterized protein n=1 Tax=Molorchus minor TaxID=1323400 RepID=A0ABQ9JSI4_9CUCU|nr:hypothetical protein NQ317_018414 [Molorchus minor]